MAAVLLAIENLAKTFAGPAGPVPALRGVSLEVAAGDFVVVQGPSGCGKSTLLLIAGGLLSPDEGRVRLEGQDVWGLSRAERARLRAEKVGFVFQQFHLIPYLSVLDNVLAAALAVPSSNSRERAMDLIERFGLGPRAEHAPAELSTGEKQRTALARALFHRPPLILADEPTGNLDAENAARVLEYLRGYAREGGGVMLVTHDAAAGEPSGRRVRMREGRVEAEPS